LSKNFENIDNKYRPIPFWSWNTKLEAEETKRQINKMNEVGIGGFFMHARGGLTTEYMGEEWFDNVSASIEEAKKLGMSAWAYDENGWPSGFGDGMVNGLGLDYQQKYLRVEDGEKQNEYTICNINGKHYYFDVNPFYVDTLSAEVTKEFIDKIYVPYYEKFGTSFAGFFTDEPQISRNGIPWSFTLPEEYKKAYGEDIYPILPELFYEIGDYKNSRMKFWKLVTDLFSKNFMKQIYDWCEEHGLSLTGHMVLEQSLLSQLDSNGAVMPHYEYFTIPGIDWLGRPIGDSLIGCQLGSVAQQLGKKQVLAEDFALCGHNVNFGELRRIFEWQMVRGITLMCQHLEGYSLEGIRKRDYPPAMYYQQPWWDEYKTFVDSMSRIGMIMSEGKVVCDTLLLHPQSSAWILYNAGDTAAIDELNDKFVKTINELEEKHILFHLGDETIMERHAKVFGNKLVIGQQSYDKIILPEYIDFLPSTKALLEEYTKNGGIITTVDALPANDIIDNKNITYTKRIYNDFDIHYFVNSTPQEQKAYISKGNKCVDIKTGELVDFDGNYTFAPFDSIVIYDDRKNEPRVLAAKDNKANPLDIDGVWKVCSSSENVITLDFCDYYFDGELIEKNGYVLNIQNRACSLEKTVEIKCVYTADIKTIPEKLYLVCEKPNQYDIFVNGLSADKTDCGYIVDSSFRKIDISKLVHEGKNEITLICNFSQSKKVYENLKKALIFESERNKLSYDMEIEPIYLCGNFGVYAKNEFTSLDKDAIRTKDGFYIGKPAKEITLKNIEQQGFLFFAGRTKLTREFDISDKNCKLVFDKTGVNAINIFVNDNFVDTLLWAPLECDISPYVKEGKNTITLEVVNNLRNMLGPHHLKEGEALSVSPRQFFKEKCFWAAEPEKTWDDDYCFVEVSLIK